MRSKENLSAECVSIVSESLRVNARSKLEAADLSDEYLDLEGNSLKYDNKRKCEEN